MFHLNFLTTWRFSVISSLTESMFLQSSVPEIWSKTVFGQFSCFKMAVCRFVASVRWTYWSQDSTYSSPSSGISIVSSLTRFYTLHPLGAILLKASNFKVYVALHRENDTTAVITFARCLVASHQRCHSIRIQIPRWDDEETQESPRSMFRIKHLEH